MNPSRNNQNQYPNNQSNNFSQFNTNFPNSSQPIYENQINEEEDEYLLEDSIDDATGQVVTRKTPYKSQSNNSNNQMQSNQPNHFQEFQHPQQNYTPQNMIHPTNLSNQQNFLSFHPQSNNQVFYDFNQGSNPQLTQVFSQQQSRIQNAQALSRASKLDESLLQIFKQNQQQLDNGFNSKGNSKIEEKSKKAVSRLSHQFFGKSGNPQDNMKSKKKTRKTVSSFGFDYKRDFTPSNIEEPKFNYENNLFSRPLNTQIQPQKMQLEASPSNKQKHSQNFVDPQNRMSQVKKKRQRLSSGMEGLSKFLKIMGSEKKEKKPSPPSKSQQVAQKRNRVTMDMNSLLSFLQSSGNEKTISSTEEEKVSALSLAPMEKQKQPKQINLAPQITQNPRPQTKNLKPSMNILSNVIIEDQNQDEFTPMKQPLKEKLIAPERSIRKLDINFATSNRKSFHQLAFGSEKKLIPNGLKDQYTRQIFNRYFCNLNERVLQKRQQYEELIRKKNLIAKEINSKLSEYTINAEKLAQWKEEEHRIRDKIYTIKQKVNKPQFDRNSHLIYKFEQTFGIQLHRLQKTSPDDGFYIEFTYDDVLFRIYRSHKKQETQCKFLSRLVYKKNKKDFQLSFDQKTSLISAFTSKKMKHIRNLTAFMTELIRYVKSLEKLEITLAHYSYINNCVSEFKLEENGTMIEFIFRCGLKFDFLFRVDLMELLENGGIRMCWANDGKNIEIPEEVVKFEMGGNKIGKCFMFAEKYVAQSVMRQIEKAIEGK